ncbi:LPXTG cell wall anchor domain-containing protein [Streptomyces sp. NPDC050617]|uniref:LPXTG cell wall anchor domain-containing protein n=1 Tax=Streptomyces sp. NPDC050617 TaxID=3154628 RepID=UPI00344A409E
MAVTGAVLLLPFEALAAEPSPGSSEGGSPGASAPAGYKITTELPAKISVDKKTGKTALTAKVTNKGAKDTDAIRLSVVGYQGMRIEAVKGCTAIPTAQLPTGSNSGFVCAIDKLATGKSRSYQVDASFDLNKAGQICLPVTLGDTKTLLWQQGPVQFGTTDTSSDAPDTPLLLGTRNVPAGSSGKSPAPDPGQSELPSTGTPSSLPLTGGIAVVLLVTGAAGIWFTTRKHGRR